MLTIINILKIRYTLIIDAAIKNMLELMGVNKHRKKSSKKNWFLMVNFLLKQYIK